MADDELNQDQSEVQVRVAPAVDDLPERLRVHSLARVLGTLELWKFAKVPSLRYSQRF